MINTSMNKDAHLLFEAYVKNRLNECWSKEQQDKYNTLKKDGYKEVSKDESSKKVTMVKHLDGTEKKITVDVSGDEHVHYNEDEEMGMKCEAASKGCDCDGCEECRANRKSEDAEMGVDPKEAKVYDDVKKDISFDNYSAWDAYASVKEGAWSEDDFLQWMRSVWADGADSAPHGHPEDNETPVTEKRGVSTKKKVFTKVEKAAERAGYSKKSAEKIAGAAKAKALKKEKKTKSEDNETLARTTVFGCGQYML